MGLNKSEINVKTMRKALKFCTNFKFSAPIIFINEILFN